jgi:hypothetical protein
MFTDQPNLEPFTPEKARIDLNKFTSRRPAGRSAETDGLTEYDKIDSS